MTPGAWDAPTVSQAGPQQTIYRGPSLPADLRRPSVAQRILASRRRPSGATRVRELGHVVDEGVASPIRRPSGRGRSSECLADGMEGQHQEEGDAEEEGDCDNGDEQADRDPDSIGDDRHTELPPSLLHVGVAQSR